MENLKIFLAVLVLQVLVVAFSLGVGFGLGKRAGFNDGYKAGQSGLFLEMSIHDSKTVQKYAKARLAGQTPI